MRTVRDAAVTALAILIIKIVFKLIPPAKEFMGFFEYGIWAGLGIITTSYIVIFVIVFLVLLVIRRRKNKEAKR